MTSNLYILCINIKKLLTLPKIHKHLANIGTPTPNCGTPTEKASEFLDHHLRPVMQECKSYISKTQMIL